MDKRQHHAMPPAGAPVKDRATDRAPNTDDEGVGRPSSTAIEPGSVRDFKRDFWAAEAPKFVTPHFRMRKVAREVLRVTSGRECDLLDLGCGPAALQQLIPPNVHYHGIDMAVTEPAPNLREADILAGPISFGGKKFDVIVAQGLFEYLGSLQDQKLAEIAALLEPGGTFIVTYMNFAHRHRHIYPAFSNVQRPEPFRRNLERHFDVARWYAGSHNWNHGIPARRFMQVSQARLNIRVPVVSSLLAVDYFYVCRPRR